ncbi:MAG: DUF3150 domain-containing protein [Terriglobales bacterium]
MPTASNPFDRAVLLAVTVKMLGVSRKVDTAEVEVSTDKDLLRVSKRILDCEEYDAIKKTVQTLKKYLKLRAVPGVKFVKGGIFPIPTSRIEEVDAKVTDFIRAFESDVATFLACYERRKSEAIARLEDLGDTDDYPPIAKVRVSFLITTDYVTLGPPQSLASINREMYDRESEKLKAKFQEAAVQVQDAMRVMFSDLLAHAVDRLKPDEDGKRKRFNASLIGNFREFIDTFADRNITDDAELAKLVGQMRGVLEGRDAESIRKNTDVRAFVTEQVVDMKAQMDRMLADRPSRAITMDEAEPADSEGVK